MMKPVDSEGWAIWITGLPGSGKSIVTRRLHQVLSEKGVRSQVLSSDALRKDLTPEPTYSEYERELVYRVITLTAKLLTENGVNVIIDSTGNLRRYRDSCRRELSSFLEVYLRCPLEACMSREESRKETYLAPRQIYRRAKAGESTTVPGIGSPYETPERPEVVVDSDQKSPEEIVQKVLDKLRKQGLIT